MNSAACALCKGTKMFCGKERCPILAKVYARTAVLPSISKLELEGSSPPGVFVGRFGWPKVHVGPLVPPFHGDTTEMDTPELWGGKTIDDIIKLRFQLVRGKSMANVKDAGLIDTGKSVKNERLITATRELALAENPSDVDVLFSKRPHGMSLGGDVQPFGPSAPLVNMESGNLKLERKIDRAHSDTDLKARDAVLELYEKGVMVSKIQKAFSVGAFGVGKRRVFVPTRWSITAVDDTIGKALMEGTKQHPIISEFRIYEHIQLDNRWIIIFLPREWCYELIEAWYPKTLWNPTGSSIEIFGDHEFFDGRKTYAEIGGCYYAARLAVNELLNRERRQAGVVILREAHPGYILPVGVWNVREAVRAALRNKPFRFETLKEALEHVQKKLEIPLKQWIGTSSVLKDEMRQKRIKDFIRAR
ncbi:MAG: Nre family DNA repair protein [Candidatus Aenigmatarchaeota archaeon]